jgi:hypothetical protein
LQWDRVHGGSSVPAGRAGDHARCPETAFGPARNRMSGRPYVVVPYSPVSPMDGGMGR